jgi:hypothetical protein
MDNVLTAIFCTVVSFFVGVILARVFPDRLGVEWGNVAEWAAAFGAFATALIAWLALRSWRDQLRGTSKHAAAAEIAEAARLTKYLFYDARNPFYDSGEFPPSYHLRLEPRTDAEEAKAWAYVYRRRYRRLNKQILRLAILRAKAGALLSEESAAGLEDLARKARELRGFFQNKINQIRAGQQAVNQWRNQRWVKRVNEAVKLEPPNDHSDPYSLEFEAKFDALMDLVRPFII